MPIKARPNGHCRAVECEGLIDSILWFDGEVIHEYIAYCAYHTLIQLAKTVATDKVQFSFVAKA